MEEVPITHYPFAGVVIGTVILQRRPVFQLEFCFCRNHTAFFLLFIFFGRGKPSGCYTEDSRLIQSSAAKIW